MGKTTLNRSCSVLLTSSFFHREFITVLVCSLYFAICILQRARFKFLLIQFNIHHAPRNKFITLPSPLLNFKLNYTLIKFTLTQKFNLKWPFPLFLHIFFSHSRVHLSAFCTIWKSFIALCYVV